MTKRRVGLVLAFLAAGLLWPRPGLGIKPGETQSYSVWEDNTDTHRTSTTGLSAFEVWVPDDETVVEARWYEEVQGGIGNWQHRGTERVSGKDRRFSRTVNLLPRENLKLEVKGIHSSPGKRKICHYTVRCLGPSDYGVAEYNSNDFTNLDTWFKADEYQRWYWAGCATWLVVNPLDKEILMMDGYVSKSTIGSNNRYTCEPPERRRIVRYVNLLRHFVGQGYRIVGLLASHDHCDHLGDIPYIFGGLKLESCGDFMETGLALTGRPYKERIPIVADTHSITNGCFGSRDHATNYQPIDDSQALHVTSLNTSEPVSIWGAPFTVCRMLQLGHFAVRPYIGDHASLADGGGGASGGRRTLAYLIYHQEPPDGTVGRRPGAGRPSPKRLSQQPARVFFTSGSIEDNSFLSGVNVSIECHHLIFTWFGHEITGASAGKIKILGHSPVGSSYIFTNHTDNNSNAGDMDDQKTDVLEMFGMFLEKNVVDPDFDLGANRMKWLGQERSVRLGVFSNRLAVGD